MADDKKITDLNTYQSPIMTDVLPIVDVTTATTKKITYKELFALPHACLSDSTTQAIANTTQAQAVTFNTQEELYAITHSTTINPSRVRIDVAGSYLILISAITDISGGAPNKHLNLWLAVDGANVPRTNTIVEMPSLSIEMTLAVSFIYNFTAGQYFEIMISGDATTVRLLATGAQTNPTRPASPSIICTVTMCSSHSG